MSATLDYTKHTYFAYHEECLRNGSFYRYTGRKKRDRFSCYINGDFMGFVNALPEGETFQQFSSKEGYKLLPISIK